MEGKVVAKYLTVSGVKTHYPFIVPKLSKWSQSCLECVLSPVSVRLFAECAEQSSELWFS